MEICKFLVEQEEGWEWELDASYRTRVKSGYAIHRTYFTVKFAKIFCCRVGSLNQQTLPTVQQCILNMYRVWLMCIHSEFQTGITDVLSVRQCRRIAAVWHTYKTSLASTRPPFPPVELDVMSRKQKLTYYVWRAVTRQQEMKYVFHQHSLQFRLDYTGDVWEFAKVLNCVYSQ